MGWFEAFTPPPDLGGVLACRYVATSVGRHVLLPDGCMDLLWIDGTGVVLCGPDTHSWAFEHGQPTAVIGLRFRPAAATAVFRTSATELVDRRVPLHDLIDGRRSRRMLDQLDHASGPVERIGVLEDLVRQRSSDGADATVGLAALLASEPSTGSGRLAEAAGQSVRQVRRRFGHQLGYGPAYFTRIARLHRFALLAARRPSAGLAQLAVNAGYVDQSHLAKDCRAIAGLTPRQVLDVLPDTSLAVTLGDLGAVADRYKTPPGRRRTMAA